MAKKKRARVVLPSNDGFWATSAVASGCVEGGFARFISLKPLTVRIIALERFRRHTFIPEDCHEFRREYAAMHTKVTTGKPYGIASLEYLKLHRLLNAVPIKRGG